MDTLEQGSSQRWHEERRNRITSSNVGQIAKRKSRTKVAATVKKLLYSKFRGNKATEWGNLQEETSREKYKELKLATTPGYLVAQCGLVVCVKHPWLAASPDGFVYDPASDPPEGLVELKNPYTARDKTLIEAAGCKNFCLQLDKEGKLALKRNHDYYYQIQCAMFCTKHQWCDFVVMTKDLHLERIYFDLNFCKKFVPKLCEFYFTAILPELASEQGAIREPEQWLTDEWTELYLQLDRN